MGKAKRNTLVLLGVVTVLILILAMSLPTLVLSPGQPFSLEQPQLQALGMSGAMSGGDTIVWIIRGVVAIALVLFPLYILYSLMTPEGRQRLITDLIVLSLLFLLANYLQKLPLQANLQPQQQVAGVPQITNDVSPLPDSVFVATPPVWLTPLIIVIASILVVIVIFVGIRVLRPRPSNENSLDDLAEEAQKAIENLNLGGDLRITVIHCYREMMHIVKQQKGIERETAMTVREFEDYLISSGLPEEAIQTLSRLFEQVRYGGTLENSRQEELALSCLADIVDACKVNRVKA
jgi:hypothetical protein